MRSAALYYVRMGYGVFPCTASNKRPRYAKGTHHRWAPDKNGPAGLTLAAWDEDDAMKHWPAGRDIAPGVVPPLGVVILDLDEKSREGVVDIVLATWPELEAAPLHRTPSGGAHIPLRQAPDTKLGQSVDPELGIDIRTHRGYVLAPPAPGYKVVRPFVPPDCLPGIPRALIEHLAPPEPLQRPVTPNRGNNITSANAYALAALSGEVERVRSAAKGGRNHQLNRSAFALGQLVAANMLDRETVEDALREAAAECGLWQEEPTSTLGTIHSGLSAGKLFPRQVADRR
jgi:hypothetical protein